MHSVVGCLPDSAYHAWLSETELVLPWVMKNIECRMLVGATAGVATCIASTCSVVSGTEEPGKLPPTNMQKESRNTPNCVVFCIKLRSGGVRHFVPFEAIQGWLSWQAGESTSACSKMVPTADFCC